MRMPPGVSTRGKRGLFNHYVYIDLYLLFLMSMSALNYGVGTWFYKISCAMGDLNHSRRISRVFKRVTPPSVWNV